MSLPTFYYIIALTGKFESDLVRSQYIIKHKWLKEYWRFLNDYSSRKLPEISSQANLEKSIQAFCFYSIFHLKLKLLLQFIPVFMNYLICS